MVPKMKKYHVFNVFMIFNGFDRLHNIDFDLNNVRAKRKFGGFRLFFYRRVLVELWETDSTICYS